MKIRKSSGRPPVVKDNASKIIPGLLKQDPQAFGYLKGRWVVRDIADAVNEVGIPISFKHVHNILKDLGLSYKRPKLIVRSNDSQYRRKEKQVRNYKASAMLPLCPMKNTRKSCAILTLDSAMSNCESKNALNTSGLHWNQGLSTSLIFLAI